VPTQTNSSYSFYLRSEMALYARLHGVTSIKVEQICERSQHNEGEEDDDEHEDDAEQDGGGRYLVWAFSTHKTEATVPFNGIEKHSVSHTFSMAEWTLTDSYRCRVADPGKMRYPHTA
jgi:hypothetical protein